MTRTLSSGCKRRNINAPLLLLLLLDGMGRDQMGWVGAERDGSEPMGRIETELGRTSAVPELDRLQPVLNWTLAVLGRASSAPGRDRGWFWSEPLPILGRASAGSWPDVGRS